MKINIIERIAQLQRLLITSRRRRIGLSAVVVSLGLLTAPSSHGTPSPTPQDVEQVDTRGAGKSVVGGMQAAFSKLPLSFIRNDGQLDRKIRFYERGPGHATFFAEDGVYLSLGYGYGLTGTASGSATRNRGATLIKLAFVGAKQAPSIVPEGQQEHRVNYFIGNDRTRWKTGIPTYRAVVYRELYPGIDIRYYGNNRQLEYDVVVKPGADPADVTFAYEGIDTLSVTDRGDLAIGVAGAEIVQTKPYIYQEIDGRRVEVAGKFIMPDAALRAEASAGSAPFRYGFEVASYDHRYPLVIDPVLEFSTYLGGDGVYDDGHGIAFDGSGNIYVVGDTASVNYFTTGPFGVPPVPIAVGPYQASNPGAPSTEDVFVVKINAAGTAMIALYTRALR